VIVGEEVEDPVTSLASTRPVETVTALNCSDAVTVALQSLNVATGEAIREAE
jgi:hypothetical protein